MNGIRLTMCLLFCFILILLYCIEEIDYSSMFWINGHTCNKIYSVVKTQLVSTYLLELVLEVYFLP